MADITGVLRQTSGARTYALRLTPSGIARLQAEHGNDLGGVLSGEAGKFPPFGVLLGIVTEALKKGEGLGEEEARELADDLMAEDIELASRVLAASFPGTGGNGRKAGKPKG